MTQDFVTQSKQTSSVVAVDQELDAFFKEAMKEELQSSPGMQTYLGIKWDYDKLDDLSDQAQAERIVRYKRDLKQLHSFPYSSLSSTSQINYQLFERMLNEEIDSDLYRHHSYPVNQMFGVHSGLVSMMLNQHLIEDKKDARDYIARLEAFETALVQLTEQLRIRENKGVLAPAFVYDSVLRDSNNIISGFPIDGAGKLNPLWDDFSKKIESLNLTAVDKKELLDQAKLAIIGPVQKGYKTLINFLKQQKEKTSTVNGVWSLPNGEQYYKHRLKLMSDTDMPALEIHQLGLDEVQRIQSEMKILLKSIGHQGSLNSYFKKIQSDPKQFYAADELGRKTFIEDNDKIITDMQSRLHEMFMVLPKSKLTVKAVEPYREKSSGLAFYQQPSEDGKRPAVYYVNLYDMKSHPKYLMKPLSFHEGVPGHHFQIARALELDNMPLFRRLSTYTPYVEGWGLYAEYFPKEFGFYSDPESDFGRLSMELLRACRLVIDTGIHYKKWTRQQALDYFLDNTSLNESKAQGQVDRYFVMPGQAVAYKIGMMKILELRERAKQNLGSKFDIREFHEAVIENGAVPLDILDELIDKFIDDKTKAA